MQTDTIVGCAVAACALGSVTLMVLWCRRSIDRIAERGFGSVREIRRKQAAAETTTIPSGLSRDLTLFQITMMGVGMMIGAGIFVGLGNAIHRAGPGGVILTFSLNGVIALLTAMSYAELSSAIPRAGGAYNFARVAFGRGASFMAGWVEWFASSVAGSMYALTLSIYSLHYLQQLGLLDWAGGYVHILEKACAVLAAGFFLYINYRGVSETGKVGAFFTLGQTLFLALIGAVGIFVAIRDPSRLQNFQPFLPAGWGKLLITMGFTFVAFEGYEVIAQTGDETVDPKRNLPKAMVYSVGIATITYALVAFATIIAVKAGSEDVVGAPWQWIGSFREKGFGVAVSRLMPMGNLLLTLAVIFAATSALNATVYSAGRVSYALGRDRLLPGALARIAAKRKTPWVALTFTGVIVVSVAAFLPTIDVAACASMMFLVLFFLVNVSVIKIRRTMGDELNYGFLIPLFPVLPVVAIICQLALIAWMVHMSLIAWAVAPLLIVAGICIYRFYGRSHAVVTEEEIQVLEEEQAPEGDEYRIMVAVADPENAIELVRNTRKICAAKQARIELLHMVPVPDQVPLSDAGEYLLTGQESIVEAMLYLSRAFPTGTSLRYCRNVARGIVSAVKEKKADLLILGWHGGAEARVFNFGSTVDPIVERSPCNVVILKDCGGNRDFKRVLVPVSGGPNAAFALEMAGILTDPEEGEITAFTVETDRGPFDADAFVDEHRGGAQFPRERIHTKAVTAHGVAQAILAEAESYDLVVVGCTQRPRLYQFATGSIPVIVARACSRPLIMVKARGLLPLTPGWLRAVRRQGR